MYYELEIDTNFVLDHSLFMNLFVLTLRKHVFRICFISVIYLNVFNLANVLMSYNY